MNPSIFQALVIAKALRLYSKTGIKANRMYTPTNMRLMAEKITGLRFASRDYISMATALEAYADNLSLAEKLNAPAHE